MQILVFGTLRDLLGVKRIEVPLETATPLAALLRAAVLQHPLLADELWTGDEKLTGRVKVLVNGQALEHLVGPRLASLGMLIEPADSLALFNRGSSDTSWLPWL